MGGNPEATPIVVNGVMYVPVAGSRILALDAETGKELWKAKLPTSGAAHLLRKGSKWVLTNGAEPAPNAQPPRGYPTPNALAKRHGLSVD